MRFGFLWQGQEYPRLIVNEEDYEEFETIFPTPGGDYFLAKISSMGEYELVRNITPDEVEIITL